MPFSNRILSDFASKNRSPILEKSLNSIGLLPGYFKITSLLDAILLPTWFHFGSQNPSKSRLGGVLRRLGSVLRCRGSVLGRLRSVLERLGTS